MKTKTMLVKYFGILMNVPVETRYISFDASIDAEPGSDLPVELWTTKPSIEEDESCWMYAENIGTIDVPASIAPSVLWEFSLIEITPAMITEGEEIDRLEWYTSIEEESAAVENWINNWCKQPSGFVEPSAAEMRTRTDRNWLMRELPGVTVDEKGGCHGQVNAPWAAHHGNPLGGMG